MLTRARCCLQTTTVQSSVLHESSQPEVQSIQCLLLTTRNARHTCSTRTYMQAEHPYTWNKINLKIKQLLNSETEPRSCSSLKTNTQSYFLRDKFYTILCGLHPKGFPNGCNILLPSADMLLPVPALGLSTCFLISSDEELLNSIYIYALYACVKYMYILAQRALPFTILPKHPTL